MYVSIWYTMGTILWTAFVYITGNFAIEFTTGTNQANLNWMYVHNAVGLIFTPIGLAIAYYFIPKSSNTPLYSHRLSMVGFWALAFVYVWTGAHHMLHGPISQWLQTIAIVFSVMLLIPVWSVVYNFFATMKGEWHQLRDNVPLKFLMSGTVFYLLTCFQGPMHSLRSVNAIVSKTDWIPGHAHMAVLGAFSFFAIAGTYYIVPRMWRTKLYSDSLANWSFWLMMIGGLGFFVTLWLGGFWQGWQWNNPSIPFIDTVVALKPIWLVRFFSGVMIFCGIVAFAYNVMATVIGRREYVHKADNSFSFAIAAALVLFFIGGLLTTVVPPLMDKSWSPSGARASSRIRRSNSRGAPIYVREGCWYCHTQQTRTLVADTKRSGWRGVDSPVSTPDEFVYDSPHMFGTKRTGPGSVARRRQVRHAVASDAFPQSAGPGARVGDAAVPVDRRQPAGVHGAGRVPADARAGQRLAAGQGLREMTDYTWPSVYFAYLFFALVRGVRGGVLLASSVRDGYWGKDSEEIKIGLRWKRLEPKIKEYADGWITEREGTEVPGFLKLAYIVIAGGCLGYFFLYMYGETSHPDRGALVRAMNAATRHRAA